MIRKHTKIAIIALIAVAAISIPSVYAVVQESFEDYCDPAPTSTIKAKYWICHDLDPRITALESIIVVNGTDGINGVNGTNGIDGPQGPVGTGGYYKEFENKFLLVYPIGPHTSNLEYGTISDVYSSTVDIEFHKGYLSEKIRYEDESSLTLMTSDFVFPSGVNATMVLKLVPMIGSSEDTVNTIVLDTCTIDAGESPEKCNVYDVNVPAKNKLFWRVAIETHVPGGLPNMLLQQIAYYPTIVSGQINTP